jgi:WS/DGAT/MGAT family acyltransferase
VKNAGGGTVNDVVMALCAGALRRWLLDHESLPTGPLIAAVPVSVRTEDQRGKGGNRVSTMIAPLATHLTDPAQRLRHAQDAMRAAKDQHGALPATLLSDVTQFAMPALAGRPRGGGPAAARRVAEPVQPNRLERPGPNLPLYYAGARLLAYYPMSAIADGQGLNVTVMSYDDGMHFGPSPTASSSPDPRPDGRLPGDELVALTKALASA